jgi:hypothetical protein
MCLIEVILQRTPSVLFGRRSPQELHAVLVKHHFWSAVEAAIVSSVVGQLNCVAAAARSHLPEAVGADIDPVSNCLLRVVFAAYEFFYHLSPFVVLVEL